MKNGPKHIMDAEDLEPLYTPQENILEECLRREAERVAHQENLMNRVVFDSVDAAPTKLNEDENQSEETKGGQPADSEHLDETAATKQAAVASSNNNNHNNDTENNGTGEQSANDCDNDTFLTPYYQPSFKNDHTLVFESRFESGNLRRAI
jgi:cytosolic carboxypeptidase protein 2/3